MIEPSTVTFKLSEEMNTWLNRAVADIDKSKSEVIRCALLLGIDTICANPSLVNRIQFEDRTRQ